MKNIELVAGLRALADFYEQHPEMAQAAVDLAKESLTEAQ